MKLSLADPKYLKDSIAIISELVNEGNFKVKKDSIELVAMDPANVAMIVFKLLGSAFTEYTIDKEIELGVNVANLKQILKRCKADDIVNLELVEENKLKVQFKGKNTKTFSLDIINIEEKEQNVPSLKFPVTINMASGLLDEAVEDADIVGEAVTFVAEPKKFTVNAEGDLSNANIEIGADDDTKITMDAGDPVKAKYSIEYLKKMIAGSKISSNVKIQFDKDYPLKLDYSVQDKVQLSFILAPRVEND